MSRGGLIRCIVPLNIRHTEMSSSATDIRPGAHPERRSVAVARGAVGVARPSGAHGLARCGSRPSDHISCVVGFVETLSDVSMDITMATGRVVGRMWGASRAPASARDVPPRCGKSARPTARVRAGAGRPRSDSC